MRRVARPVELPASSFTFHSQIANTLVPCTWNFRYPWNAIGNFRLLVRRQQARNLAGQRARATVPGKWAIEHPAMRWRVAWLIPSIPQKKVRQFLLHFVQLLVNQQREEGEQKHSRSDAEHPHGEGQFVDLGQQFCLLFLHVRIRSVEEKLVILVHRQCALVDEEHDQTYRE